MRKILIILSIATILMGFAHSVEFRSPDTYQYQTIIPMNAIFYVDQSMKNKSLSGRAYSSRCYPHSLTQRDGDRGGDSTHL